MTLTMTFTFPFKCNAIPFPSQKSYFTPFFFESNPNNTILLESPSIQIGNGAQRFLSIFIEKSPLLSISSPCVMCEEQDFFISIGKLIHVSKLAKLFILLNLPIRNAKGKKNLPLYFFSFSTFYNNQIHTFRFFKCITYKIQKFHFMQKKTSSNFFPSEINIRE